jgi:hypothetical protein
VSLYGGTREGYMACELTDSEVGVISVMLLTIDRQSG